MIKVMWQALQKYHAFAWRYSFPNWHKGWVGFVGIVGMFVGAALFDLWDLTLAVNSGLPNHLFAWIAGAMVGVLTVYFACLVWAIYLDLRPRVVAHLRNTLGGNMGPVVLMTTGLVLFVLLFGGGALWFVWLNAGANRPYTAKQADALAALHFRQAAQDFNRLAASLESESTNVLKANLAGRDAYYTTTRMGGGMHLVNSTLAKMTEMTERDFGEVFVQPRNQALDANTPAPNDGQAFDQTAYRALYHASVAARARATSFRGRYDSIVGDLDRVSLIGSGRAPAPRIP